MATKKLSFAIGSKVPSVPNDGTIYIRESKIYLPEYGRIDSSSADNSIMRLPIAEAYIGANDNIIPIGERRPTMDLQRISSIKKSTIKDDLQLNLMGLIPGHSYEIRGCYRHSRNGKGTRYIEMPNGWNLPNILAESKAPWKARVDNSWFVNHFHVDIYTTPFFKSLPNVDSSCQSVTFSSWFNVQRMIKNDPDNEDNRNCFIGQYHEHSHTSPSLKIIFRLYDVTYGAPILMAETRPIVYIVTSDVRTHVFRCPVGLDYSTFPDDGFFNLIATSSYG